MNAGTRTFRRKQTRFVDVCFWGLLRRFWRAFVTCVNIPSPRALFAAVFIRLYIYKKYSFFPALTCSGNKQLVKHLAERPLLWHKCLFIVAERPADVSHPLHQVLFRLELGPDTGLKRASVILAACLGSITRVAFHTSLPHQVPVSLSSSSNSRFS